MYLAAVLFLTLSQALGISEGSKSLFCADRVTFTLRESSTSEGCLENERSLGASAITKSKVGTNSLHPKVNLRFKVAERAALLGSITGGTGTECGHTIQGVKIAEFLEAMGSPTTADLQEKALRYQSPEWRKIHEVIQKFQTDTWSWSETSWDD
jgi:hypothetical protein